jgi:hypothetical protein
MIRVDSNHTLSSSEKKREYMKIYYQKNKEKLNNRWETYGKKWQQNNKDKTRASTQRWREKHREEELSLRKQKHRRDKVRAIKIKGGKCEECGIEYNGKNACIFHFHHRNPNEKEFSLYMHYKWERIEEELKKCDMLCANCHSLKHSGEF